MIPSKRQSVNTKGDLYVVFCDVFLYYFVSFLYRFRVVFTQFYAAINMRFTVACNSLLYSVIYKRTA